VNRSPSPAPEVRATRFGAPLPKGGTIGVPATSNPYHNRSDVHRGVEWWEERGYRVKLGDGIWDVDDYVAGSPEGRAKDLMRMFEDPEVDAVMPLWGGYGAAHLLPHLDYDTIAANPKPLVGYSDITALHVALRQEAGLATFHGPGFASFGSPERKPWTKDRCLEVLGGSTTGEVPKDPDDPYTRALVSGKATGPLVGGCLWLQQHSLGTPWEFSAEGAIWFFEDVDLPPWQIDGILFQLTQAGKLDAILGVVVGEMHKCDWREDRPEASRTKSLEDVLELRLEPLGVPVLYKLPLGHGEHLATLPLGVEATLDADARTLTIEQPALAPVP